jgi:hypothetical protein
MADERRIELDDVSIVSKPVPPAPAEPITPDVPAEAAEVLEVPVAMTAAEIDERAQVIEALRETPVREPLNDDTSLEPPLRD